MGILYYVTNTQGLPRTLVADWSTGVFHVIVNMTSFNQAIVLQSVYEKKKSPLLSAGAAVSLKCWRSTADRHSGVNYSQVKAQDVNKDSH